MLSLLKDYLARKELAELVRMKSIIQEYRRWLAEFPMIRMTLDNMLTEMEGKENLDCCHPPLATGPWTIDNLRYKLRELVKPEQSTQSGIDQDWRKEFDKKHEEMLAAQARAAELQAKLDEAAEVLLEKNREVNTLRLVCGEAYQVVGGADVPNRKALDSLYAASAGEPIPYMTFHE